MFTPRAWCLYVDCGGWKGGKGGVQFYKIQLLFLGQNVLDVGFEEGVCVEHFLADGALDGGLDLGLCARGYTVLVSIASFENKAEGVLYSFLNIVAVGCVSVESGVRLGRGAWKMLRVVVRGSSGVDRSGWVVWRVRIHMN